MNLGYLSAIGKVHCENYENKVMSYGMGKKFGLKIGTKNTLVEKKIINENITTWI